ncbi:MAG: cell division protein ZipA, partial [Bdellovibrionales bacterium CG22_combo_CG10-13_8_21_14_all_38_13]
SERADGFDDLGVGPVRVVRKSAQADVVATGTATTAKPDVVKADNPAATRHEPVTKAKREPVAEVQTELPFDEPKEPALNFSALDDVAQSAEQTFDVVEDEPEPQPASEAPSEVLILYVLLPEHS